MKTINTIFLNLRSLQSWQCQPVNTYVETCIICICICTFLFVYVFLLIFAFMFSFADISEHFLVWTNCSWHIESESKACVSGNILPISVFFVVVVNGGQIVVGRLTKCNFLQDTIACFLWCLYILYYYKWWCYDWYWTCLTWSNDLQNNVCK